MTDRVRRLAICVALFSGLGLAVSGCTGQPRSQQEIDNSLRPNDPITLQRANYVDIMLSNVYASGPLTEGDIISVISGFGGGYVTTTSESGTMNTPTQKLTLNVVLGGGSVKNSMQGEGDFDPSGIACFVYTVGYYGYAGTAGHVPCPASLTQASAEATAKRQLKTEAAAAAYGGVVAGVPTSLASAEAALKLTPATRAAMRPTDFATSSGVAALAVPQPSDTCIYIEFRRITSTVVGGGTSKVYSNLVSKAWAASTEDPCDGAAALNAGAFLTVDRGAGG